MCALGCWQSGQAASRAVAVSPTWTTSSATRTVASSKSANGSSSSMGSNVLVLLQQSNKGIQGVYGSALSRAITKSAEGPGSYGEVWAYLPSASFTSAS